MISFLVDREELEQDEKLITLGIKGRAFLFLRRSVMAAPKFHSEVSACLEDGRLPLSPV